MQNWLQELGREIQGLSLTRSSACTYRRITLPLQQTGALTSSEFFSRPV